MPSDRLFRPAIGAGTLIPALPLTPPALPLTPLALLDRPVVTAYPLIWALGLVLVRPVIAALGLLRAARRPRRVVRPRGARPLSASRPPNRRRSRR